MSAKKESTSQFFLYNPGRIHTKTAGNIWARLWINEFVNVYLINILNIQQPPLRGSPSYFCCCVLKNMLTPFFWANILFCHSSLFIRIKRINKGNKEKRINYLIILAVFITLLNNIYAVNGFYLDFRQFVLSLIVFLHKIVCVPNKLY